MKLFTKTALLGITSLVFMCTGSTRAQTMTSTVITQPCNNNGQIAVTVMGLTPPISYTYTNWLANQTVVHSGVGGTTDNLTGIGAYQNSWTNANVWQVQASDGTNSAYTSLTLTQPFTFYDSVYVANCPAMSTVQAYPSGGTSPYSFVWTNLNTSASYAANPVALPNGPYGLAVTDGAGCLLSSSTGSGSIYVYNNSGITANINGTSANCTNGTATVSASGGTAPYTYLWSNSAVTQNISGLSQGSYNCAVTDAIGCQSTGYYYIQQAVNINYNTTITNATCVQNNGAIMSFVNGGTAPYTYAWSNGATTQNISGLTGNQQYIVQITDAVGCTRVGYTYVGATTPISVTYTAIPSSCTSPTGSATLTATGGAGPYSIVWYTFPTNTTGTSISGKPSGTYSFKVTDANGCIRTGSAFIPPVSTINAILSSNAVVCPANTGNLSMSVSGSNAPFTYSWSNMTTGSSITGVPLGSYHCMVTDAVGCSVTRYASVYQVSPLSIGFSATPASCIFTADGSLNALATGGTGPYSYAWSNGQTVANATGLGTGNYYVTVTDANGCVNSNTNNHAFVGYNAANNACYCTITGTVYADANSNCIKDAGENGIPNIQIHASGLGYAFTNALGIYSFMAPTGTYTLTESVQQIYPLASCQVNNQVVSVTAATNCATTVDFANNVIVLHDLHIITTSMVPPIPGNVYTQKVIVQNDGSAVESAIQLGYEHDGQLGFSTCAPWALTQPNAGLYPNWYRFTSGFPTLNPGGSSSTLIDYNVPTNIPLNTVVNFYDSVAHVAPISTSWLTDNTPWNNVNNHQAVVIGSYDPNFKEVTPKGTGAHGDILAKDSILTYVVHFQNTGSYYAQNIVVTDSLDPDLNLASVRPGYSDHAYTVSMSDNGVMKFTFKNINLPWKSAYGDALSSGMFSYSVKFKSNSAVGTQVQNKAAIYFDYNEPVITNTTFNTIVAAPVAISLNELNFDANHAALFPNPANNYFTLVVTGVENATALLTVSDISGRTVSTKNITLHTGENSITENTASLQSGIYFVQLKSANTSIGKKLVIAK